MRGRIAIAAMGLVALLEPEDRKSLQASERAWLAWRSSECDWESSVERGGTLALTIADDCELRLTAERIASLRERLRSERAFPH